MDESSFVRAVGSGTHKGTVGESYPPMHWMTDKHFSHGCGTKVAHELAPATLGHGLGISGEHCLKQSPTDERSFMEVQVSRGEVLAYH